MQIYESPVIPDLKTNKMLFETLATFYCIVHNESKLTYGNNQVGYAL